jgi:hypothetical protein
MLNGVKKADRIERTIDGVLNNADDMQDFLRGALRYYFEKLRYTDGELKLVWELKEDME